MGFTKKIIYWLFVILFFLIPLILWPGTSEVFEFNKIVLMYLLTTLISGAWITEMIIEKKFIFRRTILDIPLLIFLGSQLISTIISIDPTTSWFGYYSRFNGGMFSVICYSLLYWAFVSNLDRKVALRTMYCVLGTAVIVSIYGILEHFGIDKNIWVQDVASRVFSTLGQPNWLAAWLVALIPLTFSYSIGNQKHKSLFFLLFSLLLFITLLFTKSRSGLLGFVVADAIFWILAFLKLKRNVLKIFLISHFLFLILGLLIGTQFTPSLKDFIEKPNPTTQPAGPALEVGGTESGAIRKIVWQGAIDVFLNYPIFGSGVETFAYSYYFFRPPAHNLTSEWDFIYNKAHNEYLNFLANSGIFGLTAYIILIGFTVYLFIKKLDNPFNLALLAGYVSLLVTNFWGFSVVPTDLLFFLFPAMAIVLSTEYVAPSEKKQIINNTQKIFVALLLCTTYYVLSTICKYWYSDTLYAKGKSFITQGRPDLALIPLATAIKFEPYQSIYMGGDGGISTAYTYLAIAANQGKNTVQAKEYMEEAINYSQRAIAISPVNINLRRIQFGTFITLTNINPNYIINAKDTLLELTKIAPTDAKIIYYLGLTYARIGQPDLALESINKAITLKNNYKEARIAKALLLLDKKENSKAKEELNYILDKIDPNDPTAKKTLESIK